LVHGASPVAEDTRDKTPSSRINQLHNAFYFFAVVMLQKKAGG
jgi:hypothetical protein